MTTDQTPRQRASSLLQKGEGGALDHDLTASGDEVANLEAPAATGAVEPRRGDIREHDGKLLRFIEHDDKGEVWEVLGPSPSTTTRGRGGGSDLATSGKGRE